ncbi:hypothetical protein DFH09DRAFT_1332963 [Mycena vulgaris]|nr:hypothetical protein DFH09DRAFT_1332963 [Mycena vulgaris]
MSKLELMRARLLIAEADKAKKNTRKANKENEKAGALGTEKKQVAGQRKRSTPMVQSDLIWSITRPLFVCVLYLSNHIGWIGASTKPREDLAACSLVYEAWLPASHLHLFLSIQITMARRRAGTPSSSRHTSPRPWHVEILEDRTFTKALPQIAQLTTVASLGVCAAFRTVSALELRNGTIRNTLQLMPILSHFALLERVALVEVKVNDFPPIPEKLAGTLSPYLHTIKIAYRHSVLGLEDWLCKPSELASAGCLVQHLGSHLYTLSLSFISDFDSCIYVHAPRD